MNEREASQRPHPPACTCVACNQRRLQRQQRGSLFHRLLRRIGLRR